MAFDTAWMICSKCGRQPSDSAPGGIIGFSVKDSVVLCDRCDPPREEKACPTCNGHGTVPVEPSNQKGSS